MNRSKLASILKILLSCSLLGLLCWLKREKFDEIWNLLKSIDTSVFSLGFLIFVCTLAMVSWRLRIILAAQKAFFTIKDLFALTLIGYFFNNFMPTSVGGDLVKGYYISQKTKNKMLSYAAVFVDRLVGMSSLIFIASIATLIIRGDIKEGFILWAVALLLVLCVIFTLLLFNKSLLKKVGGYFRLTHLLQILKLDSVTKRIYNAVNIYTNHKREILRAFTISLLTQLIAFSVVYLLTLSLGVRIPFMRILLIMPIIAILLMLPITFNGLGLREWSFVFFFSPNIGDAAAFSLSILYYAIYLLGSLIGGAVYLFRR